MKFRSDRYPTATRECIEKRFKALKIAKYEGEDSTLSFWDAVFPFRLYGMLGKRLPNTRHSLYLGIWGAAAIISAVIFIGGLGHWVNYLPGAQKTPSQKAKYGM